jgi:hypothetical protein
MHDLAEAFAEGGWAMYPMTLLMCLLPGFGVAFLTAGILSKRNLALPLSAALFLLSILGPAFGIWAEASSMRESERAVMMAAPDDKELLMNAARGESMVVREWGFATAAIPLLLACVLAGIGLTRLERFTPKSSVE